MARYISASYHVMLVSTLFLHLIAHVQGRIRRGEFTERALARRAGISQPHLHNVLKGKREMSPRTADALLRELGIGVVELIERTGPPRDRSREPVERSVPN